MFKRNDMNALTRVIVYILSTSRLGYVKTKKIDDTEYIMLGNMTLINFVIHVIGPLHERQVTQVLMLIQVMKSFFLDGLFVISVIQYGTILSSTRKCNFVNKEHL